ncbi:MAG: nucleoside monophosphate kinase [Verrucomicrobiae bacterium]|nr:nucleoside monophosphate kinase [Verrucomicrobiae bacterium]MCB1092125.1 nucleoside monophosphate kinase [Verrucomicrobiae bacterium]
MPDSLDPKPSKSTKKEDGNAVDLEVKDANLIFNAAWQELEDEVGIEGLRFPNEVIWLNGAPGAGKGTQTRFIQQYRGLTAEPIVVSALLHSPAARKLIDAGLMVGDREVTGLVLRALLRPENQTGVVVDGYPRTKVQVFCLRLLHEKLNALRQKYIGTPLSSQFRKPMFHIVVLFVDEAESVRRQIFRGERALIHNAGVEASGVGTPEETRATDLSEEAARNRYRTFKEVTYESLKSLREVFYYHYVNAHGTIEEVQRRIQDELRYQSSLELDQSTFDRISRIPVARNLSIHARQDLVKRLDSYNEEHPDLFEQCVALIDEKFMPIIRKHTMSGKAYINSESAFLSNAMVLGMIIDIFADRGYDTVIDIRRYDVPSRFDLETGEIQTREKTVWRFIVTFPGSRVRRGQ